MIILGTNSIKDTGYDVANSCRFNQPDSAYLNRTLGTATNRKKFTFSLWFKRSSLTNNYGNLITGGTDGGTNIDEFTLHSSDKLSFQGYESSTQEFQLRTNQLFRDVSAWYHAVVAYDSTQGTASNRIKMYVNGTQVTSFAIETYPDENHEPLFNSNVSHLIGRYFEGSNYYNGYIAEVVFIDGSALAPTSFGEFDEDSPTIWKPIDVSGLTFGNNGFYLDFEDSANLGNDANGGTDFTENNLTAVDQATDTPTNNFATLNPLANYYNASTFSEGNLQIVTHASNEAYNTGTIGVASGKWYWEVKVTSAQPYEYIGISDRTANASDFSAWTNSNGAVAYYSNNGDYRKGSAGSNTSYGNSYGTNDIVGIALDVDNMKIYFSKNGTWQNSGDPTSGATGTGAISLNTPIINDGVLYPALGEIYTATSTFQLNFGSPPFSISSGNADDNGYGNFEYDVPNSYYSLCSKNLAEYG